MIEASKWINNIHPIVKDSRTAGRIALVCILSKSLLNAKNAKLSLKTLLWGIEIGVHVDRFLFKKSTEPLHFFRQQTAHQKQNP